MSAPLLDPRRCGPRFTFPGRPARVRLALGAVVLAGAFCATRDASARPGMVRTLVSIDPSADGPDAFARGASGPERSAAPTTVVAATADRPATVKPQPAFDTKRLRFGLRFLYGVPMGDAEGVPGGRLARALGHQGNLLVDMGTAFTPAVTGGFYLGLGVGGAGSAFERACDQDGADCNSVAFRAGVAVDVHPWADRRFSPRFGLGMGMVTEGSHAERATGERVSLSYKGLELARLSAGVDVRVSKQLTLGPTVDFTTGLYTTVEANGAGGAAEGAVSGAMHHWLSFGLRLGVLP